MEGRSRRSFLRRSGAALGVALAGCLDRSGSQSSPTNTPTDTPTPTNEPTTPSPESSPTPSDEPVVWTFETGGPIPGTPAVADGTVFVASENGTLYALAEGSGQEIWRFEAEAPFRAVPLVRDGVVVARSGGQGLGGEQVVHAIDAETGEDIWRHPHSWWLEVPGERDGTVYVATADAALSPEGQTLYALSLDDGTEAWSAEIGDPRGGLVTDDAVYVPSYGRLYAFDTETGSQRWAADLPDYFYRTIATVGDAICYVAEDDDHRGVLHARDAATGDERWRFDDWFVSSTTSHDGTLVAGGKQIAAIDPGTGTAQWQTDAGGFVPRAPVRDGVLYAGGDAAREIAIADGTVQWSWTPDVAVQGLVPAGVGHGAAYFDSFRDADPRNRFKFAVETGSGSNRWTFGPETNLTDMTVGDDRILVGGTDGVAYGISP